MTKKILIIDDETEVQTLLTELLQLKGYEVHSALNGQQGLNLIQSLRPDLILLDVMMPAIDGFKVQNQLALDENFKKIPIIFISGQHNIDNAAKAIAHGAAGFIEKPFDIPQLCKIIEMAL